MSFSISTHLRDDELLPVAKQLLKTLTKRQRSILVYTLSQQEEAIQEENPGGPVVHSIIVKPLSCRNKLPFLSDLEKIVFASSQLGVGSVRMSAYLRIGERQIRRVLTKACENFEEQKAQGNVRLDMYTEAIKHEEVIRDEEGLDDDSGSFSEAEYL